MKEIRVKPFMEAGTVAVLAGLAIGLGIALHEAFFFVAFLIALAAAIEWGNPGDSRASACSQSQADASASVRADLRRAINCIIWHRNRVGVAFSARMLDKISAARARRANRGLPCELGRGIR